MKPRSSSFRRVHRPGAWLALAAVTIGALALELPAMGAASGSAEAPTRPGLAYASDRVIVAFEAGSSSRLQARSLRAVGATAARTVSPLVSSTVVLDLVGDQTVANAIATLETQPGVAYAEPDYWLEAAATSDDPYFLDGSHWGMYGAASTPSNRYGSAAAEAWARGHVGSSTVYVAVIDEGLAVDHPDLRANVWTNPFDPVDGIDNDGNGYVDDVHGYDFSHDDASVYDGVQDDHGTHVAGTIGARGGNGIGVAGVSWRVGLIAGKFLGLDGGWTSDAIRAIDYVTDLRLRHGLDIVATNNSYSGANRSQALLDAIERGGDAGILFVTAAGNGGADLGVAPAYPAAYDCEHTGAGELRGWDCIITVASLEPDGRLRSDSNHGAALVDIGAPGSGIVSTVPNGDGYAWFDGTSMAAAHVSGAIALCHAADRRQTARQLRAQLVASATRTASLAHNTSSGGRLDVGALVGSCDPGWDPPPSPTPQATPTPSEAPSSTPAPAVPIVVDDLDPEFRTFGTGWSEGSSGYGGHHYYVPVQPSERLHFASWKPTLPAAGSYVVQARIPLEHATTRRAAYRLKTVGGWVTRRRNQFYHRGSWMPLGTHDLTTTPIVQLADRTGEDLDSGRSLAFDAIRLIPTPETRARIEIVEGSGR